jgi:hypothetical protein
MANTYTLIASATVGSGGAASIDFTSIPSTYTDLCILASIRTSRTGVIYGNMKLKFNTSTSNITGRFIRGIDASTVESFTTTAAEWSAPTSGTTANTFGNAMIYITNYAGSGNKSVSLDSVIEDNASGQFNYLSVGLWSQSAPITDLTIYSSDASPTLVQYSTAYLYGIKNS